MHTKFQLENHKGKDNLGDQGIDARRKTDVTEVRCKLDSCGSEQGPSASCEHGNEP
jgi:hypothetical protein